jgi:CRP-like cAMP-binding protein
MNQQEKKMNIESLSFFEGIDSSVIQEMNQASSIKNFQAGDTVFEKGNPADCLYILEQGDINLLLRKHDDTTLNLSEPGEVFGWSSLVENGVYTSTAKVEKKASVRCIPKTKMDPIFSRNAKDAVVLYRKIGDIFSKRMSRVVD